MSATAAKRKAGKAVTVTELELPDEDWFTPKMPKVAPLRVEVTLGERRKGRVCCAIEETDWEHQHVDLEISFEKFSVTGLHSSVENGTLGTFTRDQIDRLIDALKLVRDEADARGLFKPRPTPTTVEEVLAAGNARGRFPRTPWRVKSA